MKAIVLHEWVRSWGNNLRLEEVPTPKPGPRDVLIRVRACGVGYTVTKFLMSKDDGGADPLLLPRIPGHEIAGDVVETGEKVFEYKKGERVLVYFYLICGRCQCCLAGEQNHCVNRKGLVGMHIDGGYAEYVNVPVQNVLPLPDSIPYRDATVINDAVATPVHVMKHRALVKPGDTILIVGAGGGVGVHAVQAAKFCGGRVIGADVDDAKLKQLKDFGATEVINVKDQSMLDEVKRLTNGNGVDAAVDFVCNQKTLIDTANCLGRRGRMVVMAQPQIPLSILSSPVLIAREVTITGSRYATFQDFMEATELVRRSIIKPVIGEEGELEDAEKIHSHIAQNKIFGRGVVTL
jgi:propanol-preferring alcohol dehydrogenase